MNETKNIGIIALALFVIICAVASSTIIGAGERGVRITLGKVSNESLAEGIYFKIPFIQQIFKFDVKTQRKNIETQVYTKDIQQAKLTCVINYNLRPDFAPEMYKTVGRDYEERIIMPLAEGIIKDITGKWIANDLIGNREVATTEIFNILNKELDKRGIVTTAFNITNIEYAPEFERAVEEKVKAQQEALKAKNKTVQVEEEAKQKLTKARADAEAMRIQAQALQQNKNLVEYEAVQKWDGKLPEYMMGNSIPFINMSKAPTR